MKKILVILILCLGILGCKSKEDKVMEKLEKVAYNPRVTSLTMYCVQVESVFRAYEVTPKDNCLTKVINLTDERHRIFKEKFSDIIKKNSIEDSVSTLKTPYILNQEIIVGNAITDVFGDIVTAADNEPKFDILGRLKILNLTALIMRDFDLKLNDYMKKSYDIINNNDENWQIEMLSKIQE